MAAFYRILADDTPDRVDFLSYAALGRLPRRHLTAQQRRSWQSVSMYDSEGEASRIAYERNLGVAIAMVDLPEDGSVLYQQTGGNPHHYDVWAEADTLLRRIVRVVPV